MNTYAVRVNDSGVLVVQPVTDDDKTDPNALYFER